MDSADDFHLSRAVICPHCLHPNTVTPAILEYKEPAVLMVCGFCLGTEMLPPPLDLSLVPWYCFDDPRDDSSLRNRLFWARGAETGRPRIGDLQYLLDDAGFSPPDSLVPGQAELETRLQAMEKWRAMPEDREHWPMKPFFYTTLQLATSLVMPLDRLITGPNPSVYCGGTMSSWLYFMVRGELPGFSKPTDNLPPSLAAVAECLRRDRNSCVLTEWLDPEVTHILPSNESDMNLELLKRSLPLLDALLGTEVASQVCNFATTMNGSTDKAWNMLSLRPCFIEWWRQGHFGIKCLDVLPCNNSTCRVRLQFHWMPQHGRDPNGLLRTELKDVAEEISRHPGRKQVPSVRMASGRELVSGVFVDVEIERRLAEAFKLAIDIRWACSLILAFSGIPRAGEQGDCLSEWDAEGNHTQESEEDEQSEEAGGEEQPNETGEEAEESREEESEEESEDEMGAASPAQTNWEADDEDDWVLDDESH